MITSSHNPKLKLIRALAGRPRERREAGLFLAEGARLVEDALAAGWPFEFALFSAEISNRGKKVVEQLVSSGVSVEEVTAEVFRAASETESSQGVVAALKLDSLPVPENPSFVLIPDQIRDPGNLGTLLRTAAALGVDAVFIPPETTDPWAPKVVRAGMGAHFRLAVATAGWEEIHTSVGQMQVSLADARGETPLWDVDFHSQKIALIVGGEADGASEAAKELADNLVKIPMPGKIESLNAAVAGALLMYEVARQRR